MKLIHRLMLPLGLVILLAACGGSSIEIPAGSEITVETRDGVEIRGTLVEVRPDQVVLDTGGGRLEVPRRDIRSITTTSLEVVRNRQDGETRTPVGTAGRGPEYRDVTIPAGTLLPAALQSPLASDETRVEAPVRATLRRPVVVDGVEVLAAGTTVYGRVTSVQTSGRVKGRASVSFRFNGVDTPEGGRAGIATSPITRVARGTKKQDAAKIGAGAAGGAIVGGILGGGDGAAKGAAVGGAAGTGVVLATKGEEVRLAAGTPLSIRLSGPLTVKVPQV